MIREVRERLNRYFKENERKVLDFFSPYFAQEDFRDIELSKENRTIGCPVVLTMKQKNSIERTLVRLLDFMAIVPDLYFNADYHAYYKTLGFNEAHCDIFMKYKQFDVQRYLARPDFIFDGRKLSLCELNVSSALGGIVTNEFLNNDLFKNLLDSSGVLSNEEYLFPSPGDGFQKLFDKMAPHPGKKNVAIVEWKKHFEEEAVFLKRFKRVLEKRGYNAFICDPGDFIWDNGLKLEGNKIDIVYRMFLWEFEDLGTDTRLDALLKAIENNDILFLLFISSRIYSTKNQLALLSELAESDSVRPEHKKLINECIPWSRIVKEQRTSYRGESIDAIPFIRKHKHLFIIKPSSLYGGQGVFIGKDLTQNEWDTVIDHAVEKRDSIIQEYVEPFVISLPVVDNNDRRVYIRDFKCIFSLFIIDFEASGFYIRAQDSESNIINASLEALNTSAIIRNH